MLTRSVCGCADEVLSEGEKAVYTAAQYAFWSRLELIYLGALIVCSVLYLFVRSLTNFSVYNYYLQKILSSETWQGRVWNIKKQTK